MGGEWKYRKIEDVAEKVAMGPFGSSIKIATFVDNGIPVISGNHLRECRLQDNTYNYITPEHADKLKNANVFRGDVIFTHAGNIGNVSYIPEDSLYDRYVLSQRQFYMRCNTNSVIPEFIVYYFKTSFGQHQLLANTSSTGVPSIAQPVSYLRRLVIPIPPLAEQRAIAHILGTLDDKIELNRRMNETLEGMARALFKSWFVDFDPVRAKAEGRDPGLPKDLADLFPDEFEDSELGEIPKGWKVYGLDEIAVFLNGLALQKYPPGEGRSLAVIKIAQLRKGNSSGADRCSAFIPVDYFVDDGDVLFSWSGSLECVLWSGGLGALNQHLFKVTSENFPKWFYYLWIHEHLGEFRHIAAGKATTMGHIQRGHLSAAKVLVPPRPLLDAMTIVLFPLIEKINVIAEESRTLASLRDALLPKLISGELRIADAERFLEKAT